MDAAAKVKPPEDPYPNLPEGTEVRYRCHLCGQESMLRTFAVTHQCPNLPPPPTPVIVSFYPAVAGDGEAGPTPKPDAQPYERR